MAGSVNGLPAAGETLLNTGGREDQIYLTSKKTPFCKTDTGFLEATD